MKAEHKLQIAIHSVGFDYFTQCINNGATPEQAKAEMMTEKAQKEIAMMVKQVMEQ